MKIFVQLKWVQLFKQREVAKITSGNVSQVAAFRCDQRAREGRRNALPANILLLLLLANAGNIVQIVLCKFTA